MQCQLAIIMCVSGDTLWSCKANLANILVAIGLQTKLNKI